MRSQNAEFAEKGGMVKYIVLASCWLAVVCALVSVIVRICDAPGSAFCAHIDEGQ